MFILNEISIIRFYRTDDNVNISTKSFTNCHKDDDNTTLNMIE